MGLQVIHSFFVALGCAMSSMSAIDPVIKCKDLTFSYDPLLPNVLKNVSFELNRGARLLLVGANGAGKTTLLKVLAGRHMVDYRIVTVLGKEAFHDTTLCGHVTYLGERWTQVGDVAVRDLIGLEKEDGHRDRRLSLLDILDVDPDWRVYRLSDGQRRRVQLVMSFSLPAEVMLLDEISTDLDVVGRQNLLRFLYNESITNNVTIIYSTHIFDGLETWSTHIGHINEGPLVTIQNMSECKELQDAKEQGITTPLFHVVESWLREDWKQSRTSKGKKVSEFPQGVFDKQYFTDWSRTYGLPAPDLSGMGKEILSDK